MPHCYHTHKKLSENEQERFKMNQTSKTVLLCMIFYLLRTLYCSFYLMILLFLIMLLRGLRFSFFSCLVSIQFFRQFRQLFFFTVVFASFGCRTFFREKKLIICCANGGIFLQSPRKKSFFCLRSIYNFSFFSSFSFVVS